MSKMLYPSCSETTFKLVGSLKEIKAQVVMMLDIIYQDYVSNSDASWIVRVGEMVDDSKKEVMAAKSLKDFETIVFPFTINYETFFKNKAPGELSVATCNNTEWDDLDYQTEEEDYWALAGQHYFDVNIYGKDWCVLERTKSDKNGEDAGTEYFPIERADKKPFHFKEMKEDATSAIKLYVSPDGKRFKKDDMKFGNGDYVLVTDKKKLNKINEKIFIKQI